MGAPNLIRDTSTNGNLKASEVLQQGILTGLVSDYYPESLCQAAFLAARHCHSLEDALTTVTSGPGKFLNCPSMPGLLASGSEADIIIVNQDHTWAHVARTCVRGRPVFQIHDTRFVQKEAS